MTRFERWPSVQGDQEPLRTRPNVKSRICREIALREVSAFGASPEGSQIGRRQSPDCRLSRILQRPAMPEEFDAFDSAGARWTEIEDRDAVELEVRL